MIRCVGVPAIRFREDALRIIRALRFASTLGFRIDPETEAALAELAPLLRKIAAERIMTEFTGLICGAHVRKVLEDYRAVIAEVIPEIRPMFGFDQRNPYHDHDIWAHTARVVEGVPPERVIRLTAFFHDIGKPSTFTQSADGVGHFYGHDASGARIASEILHRMKCDTRTRKQVETLIRIHCVPLSPDDKIVRRRLNRYGEKVVNMLIDLKIADAKAQSARSRDRVQPLFETREAVLRVLAQNECFSIKGLAINGSDLLNSGFREGPEIGKLLSGMLEKVLRGEIENDREALLGFVKNRLEDISKDSTKACSGSE